jgi:hypothetical protein
MQEDKFKCGKSKTRINNCSLDTYKSKTEHDARGQRETACNILREQTEMDRIQLNPIHVCKDKWIRQFKDL